jgi:hypothetical protein
MTSQHHSTRPPLAPQEGLVILSCSAEKLVTDEPIQAWNLYQGACVPQARARFADRPAHRERFRILSAAHGLLHPDDMISAYDRRLTTRSQALRLHEQVVASQLDAEVDDASGVRRVLIIVEPLYLLALQRIFDHLGQFTEVSILPNPSAWADGLAVLERWGWA